MWTEGKVLFHSWNTFWIQQPSRINSKLFTYTPIRAHMQNHILGGKSWKLPFQWDGMRGYFIVLLFMIRFKTNLGTCISEISILLYSSRDWESWKDSKNITILLRISQKNFLLGQNLCSKYTCHKEKRRKIDSTILGLVY